MSTIDPRVAKKTKFRKVNAKGYARKKSSKKTKTNGSKHPASNAVNTSNRPCIEMYAGDHSTIADQVERLLIQMMSSSFNAAAN